MVIVTGGAGLIGSAIIWALNKRDETDIVIVDELDHDRKERNIAPLAYERLVGITEFREQLLSGDWDDNDVEAIIHLGACSDTTETNWDYLEDNNVEYSKDVIRWATDNNIRCLYASSAATYGNGEHGFDDDHELFDRLEPLNLYGKSKLLVDMWARDGGYLDKAVGLRYFNVFGPNEWHKEHMRSVINKKFPEVLEGEIKLFKSEHPDYADGEQDRDFIYVKDAVAATLFFLDAPGVNGVFNIGTGQAGTWNEIAQAMFAAVGREAKITYIDLPEHLRGHYQYHTEADLTKLEKSGFKQDFMSLDEAIADYVKNYLKPDLHLGDK